jgi:hypothetical protein
MKKPVSTLPDAEMQAVPAALARAARAAKALARRTHTPFVVRDPGTGEAQVSRSGRASKAKRAA